jgi:hypothetical protein
VGLIGSILLATIGLVATLVVMPRLTQQAIRRAARKLPERRRDRMVEEWTADVADTPGDVSKLIRACGFMRASTKIMRDQQRCMPNPAKPEAKVIYASAAMNGSAAVKIWLDIANATYTKQPVPKAPGP